MASKQVTRLLFLIACVVFVAQCFMMCEAARSLSDTAFTQRLGKLRAVASANSDIVRKLIEEIDTEDAEVTTLEMLPLGTLHGASAAGCYYGGYGSYGSGPGYSPCY